MYKFGVTCIHSMYMIYNQLDLESEWVNPLLKNDYIK